MLTMNFVDTLIAQKLKINLDLLPINSYYNLVSSILEKEEN